MVKNGFRSSLINGRTDFRLNFADFRNFSGPYDGHTYSPPPQKTRKRTDGPSGIKKNTDGHGLHLGIPWPSLVYSEGHGDCSAFALDARWYRRTPIPVSRVVQGDTSIGSIFDLAEANHLHPTWRSSNLQKSKGESEPPPP